MENLLKNRKVRVTPFRLDDLDVFNSFDNSIVLSQLEQKLGDFDRITLYRTLKTFQEKGLIHEIVRTGEIKKYALCEESCGDDNHHHQHNHLHFYCKGCQEIYCIDLKEYPEIKLPKFKIDSIELQADGLCDKCC
jgi:Fur family ferric uptake transcriptional regulator